ncbi:alpha/beta fold hydrolase [Natrarchaeobius sp. A-rgal3]|uniref:alpha/beta fold hydrolase n=1 Tax=Natrarchaeobius versutus TaxID=1679078 RepID=UPI00350F5C21
METATSADGTAIAYQRTGSGPPLVLVHGNGDVHKFWDMAGARPALAEHCTVYVIERRGRGESGDAVEYELKRESEDVAAVVNSIDEPVTLLGHSGGALYSLEASLRTDNLRKLILNEPPLTVGNHELGVEEGIAEMNRLLDDGHNEQVLVFFLQEVGGLTPAELDAARSSPIWQDMVDAAHTLSRELQAIAEYEFDATRFEEMTTPALLMTGSESPPFYKDAIKAANSTLPNSQISTFEGHQHEPMNTAPDRFVDEVLSFVRIPNDSNN